MVFPACACRVTTGIPLPVSLPPEPDPLITARAKMGCAVGNHTKSASKLKTTCLPVLIIHPPGSIRYSVLQCSERPLPGRYRDRYRIVTKGILGKETSLAVPWGKCAMNAERPRQNRGMWNVGS